MTKDSSIPVFASASFVDLLGDSASTPFDSELANVPHGTTIVAVRYAEGVLMAGDRRATVGHAIVHRDIEKVAAVDRFSVVGVAGSAGIARELQRLFSVELEHYEKIERVPLSLSGKAQRLAGLVRSHLGLAFRGLIAVPLLAGWDLGAGTGRMFSFDATGGCYEEHDWCALGSGAPYAKGSIKKLFRDGMSESEAATMLIQALVDAADDDTATSGYDPNRRIYPNLISASAEGIHEWSEQEVELVVKQVLASRQNRPDGPGAPLL